MSEETPLPVGKLPAGLLASLLGTLAHTDERVVVRPGVGEDIAAIDFGDRYLIAKTDPITFAADRAGWYLAHVNANDIATAGARPAWCLVTALLPQGRTTRALVADLFRDLAESLKSLNVALCGGHTEITFGLDRPILVGTMLGEVAKERLVDKRRARAGDAVLLTKWVPIEGTALIARERAGALRAAFSAGEITRAAQCLTDPGISIVPEAMAAAGAATIHAMHDVTEGGLSGGLYELAAATGTGVDVDAQAIPVDPLALRVCGHVGLDPMGTISSGALLIATDPGDAERVAEAVRAAGVACTRIGTLTDAPGRCTLRDAGGTRALPAFERDEIARVFES